MNAPRYKYHLILTVTAAKEVCGLRILGFDTPSVLQRVRGLKGIPRINFQHVAVLILRSPTIDRDVANLVSRVHSLLPCYKNRKRFRRDLRALKLS